MPSTSFVLKTFSIFFLQINPMRPPAGILELSQPCFRRADGEAIADGGGGLRPWDDGSGGGLGRWGHCDLRGGSGQ